jgi:hypothetical protein
MNIFALDHDPKKAAEYHIDKHAIKMILETAQLLSTAHHILDNEPKPGLYQPTHANHPSAKWARETSGNYIWLLDLGFALLAEYRRRYGKTHKTTGVLKALCTLPKNIKMDAKTPFAQAMPEKYKHHDPITAYRNYYIQEKAKIATWKNGIPTWWPQEETNALLSTQTR